MMAADLDFASLRGLSGNTHITDVPCPMCVGECKTPAGRQRKCLRIWDDGEDFITFTCARCGVSGHAKPDDGSITAATPKVEKKPVEKQDKSGLCNFLWDKSAPAIGSLAEVYLRGRGCWPVHPCHHIRFLSAREHNGKQYEPAMVSRFGFEGDPVTGVHMTKLAADGHGKAGTDADKLTIGDTLGQPIVIHTNEERDDIVIAEGIEDTSSLVIVTGWTGWAAGTAGRIPAVVATAVKRGYRRIYVAKDDDTLKTASQAQPYGERAKVLPEKEPASWRAMDQARAITPIIPLNFGRNIIGMAEHLDANATLQRFGSEFVLAAIQWCELQEDWRQGLLPIHQFQRRLEPINKILRPGS